MLATIVFRVFSHPSPV